MNVQFVHDLLAMFLDRLDADVQFGRNLLVRESLGNKLQHFGLARGQFPGLPRRLAGGESLTALIAQAFGNRRAEKRVPSLHFANRSYQIVGKRFA